jgi:hypothetical protein
MEATHDNGARAYALAVLDRVEEARIEANRLFDRDGRPDTLINVLVVGGRYREAVQVIDERWPDLQAFQLEFSPFSGFGDVVMLDLALAFHGIGDSVRESQALAMARAEHNRQHALGMDTLFLDVAEASYYALSGEQELALDWLAKAVDRGYSIAPRLAEAVPQFRELEGLPRYEELQTLSLAHMNVQRALLDLPPLEAGS